MRTHFALLALAALGGCYNPNISANPDANMGFHCYATDTPPCPSGYVCCAAQGSQQLCGDDLLNKSPSSEGWCVPPQQQTPSKPWLQWDLGEKAMVVAATMDPMLLGPGCLRDDKTPLAQQPPQIRRMFEPNDTPMQAINYNGSGLPLDTMPAASMYQICPDKSAPMVPDVDVLAFRISPGTNSTVWVVVDVRYQVASGDLDAGLFNLNPDPVSGGLVPMLIKADVSARDNACVSTQLGAGTYYAVIRGAPNQPGPYNMGTSYALNNYTLRIYALSPSATDPCTTVPAPDMH